MEIHFLRKFQFQIIKRKEGIQPCSSDNLPHVLKTLILLTTNNFLGFVPKPSGQKDKMDNFEAVSCIK